jgi:hypothetical protein
VLEPSNNTKRESAYTSVVSTDKSIEFRSTPLSVQCPPAVALAPALSGADDCGRGLSEKAVVKVT